MKYRKKPIEVEAVQWNGDNFDEMKSFIGVSAIWCPSDKNIVLQIVTLEGVMQANVGDYIIKSVKGEFYPCKPDIFEKTYEKVCEG